MQTVNGHGGFKFKNKSLVTACIESKLLVDSLTLMTSMHHLGNPEAPNGSYCDLEPQFIETKKGFQGS